MQNKGLLRRTESLRAAGETETSSQEEPTKRMRQMVAPLAGKENDMVRPVGDTRVKVAWWQQLTRDDRVKMKQPLALLSGGLVSCRQRRPTNFYKPQRLRAELPVSRRLVRYWRRRPRGVFRDNRD